MCRSSKLTGLTKRVDKEKDESCMQKGRGLVSGDTYTYEGHLSRVDSSSGSDSDSVNMGRSKSRTQKPRVVV